MTRFTRLTVVGVVVAGLGVVTHAQLTTKRAGPMDPHTVVLPGVDAEATHIVGSDGESADIMPGATATATLANVSDTASSATLQALNTDRIGLIILNDSTERLCVKYGATAVFPTSCTTVVLPGQTWNMPYPIYTGVVDGDWEADASGAARMTELAE